MLILRSVAGVFLGLVVISLIVESLEFGLVTLVHGGVTTDPDVYFGVRNRPGVLAAKLVYNSAAAVVGGLVVARVAGRAALAHGIVLAVVQTIAFGWALMNPALRQSTPDWMWASLIILTAAGIIGGSALEVRRHTHKRVQAIHDSGVAR